MIDWNSLNSALGNWANTYYGGQGQLQSGRYSGELSLLEPQLEEQRRQFDLSNALANRSLGEQRRQFDVLNALTPQLQAEQLNQARQAAQDQFTRSGIDAVNQAWSSPMAQNWMTNDAWREFTNRMARQPGLGLQGQRSWENLGYFPIQLSGR